MISNLDIQVEDTNNCKILKLVDNSIYNPDLEVENGIIEVTVPGYDCAVIFEVDKDFTLLLTSASLNIAPFSSYSHLLPLPEGVYSIKYSIKPNSSLYVEYNYLRNCGQKQLYIKSICDTFDSECNRCENDFKESIEKLSWIRQLMAAAKYKVEDCDDPEAGLDLYNEANGLLKDFCK